MANLIPCLDSLNRRGTRRWRSLSVRRYANRWTEFEGEYAKNFPTEMGAPAKPFRMTLGALIIKEKLGTSDRETVEQTDLDLLATARVESEKIIDILDRENSPKGKRKSRTHRQLARKEYLKVAKQRRPTHKSRRKAIKKQLQYLNRSLAHIKRLLDVSRSIPLKRKQHRQLLIIREVYRQ